MPTRLLVDATIKGARVSCIQRCSLSARQIMDTYGRDAARHVLDLAHLAIQSGPDAEEIERLALLMREIEARQHRRIQAVARQYA